MGTVGEVEKMNKRALTWSYGGGTQSVAIAVLVAQGKLPKPECVAMADTGREASETWEYTERHVRPMLAAVGVTLYVVNEQEGGDVPELYGGEDDDTLLIPAYSQDGALSTFCSGRWKRDPVTRFFRQMGFGPKKPTRNWVGFSIDELRRVQPDRALWQQAAYPLIFDVPMRRSECAELVTRAGLPHPPKSSCWMCPYRRNHQWRRLRDHYPKDFAKACALDDEIRARDKQGGVWLHDSRVPLREANLEPPEEPPLFKLLGEPDKITEERACNSGMCWV